MSAGARWPAAAARGSTASPNACRCSGPRARCHVGVFRVEPGGHRQRPARALAHPRRMQPRSVSPSPCAPRRASGLTPLLVLGAARQYGESQSNREDRCEAEDQDAGWRFLPGRPDATRWGGPDAAPSGTGRERTAGGKLTGRCLPDVLVVWSLQPSHPRQISAPPARSVCSAGGDDLRHGAEGRPAHARGGWDWPVGLASQVSRQTPSSTPPRPGHPKMPARCPVTAIGSHPSRQEGRRRSGRGRWRTAPGRPPADASLPRGINQCCPSVRKAVAGAAPPHELLVVIRGSLGWPHRPTPYLPMGSRAWAPPPHELVARASHVGFQNRG